MYALFGILNCPDCGGFLPVKDIVYGAEPALMTVTCPGCRAAWKVLDDKVRGFVIEERKDN
jgi:uncharacterized protein YbaR (Trm112 family)